jgi:hypothetical protein
MRILFHHLEGWKRPELRLSRTLAWVGMGIGMGIGLSHCGWGSDPSSTQTDPKTHEQSAQSAETSDKTANTQARAGKTGGGTNPIRSLLPEQASEPISPDGRALGATSRPKNASVRESRSEEFDTRGGQDRHRIDRQGRQVEEVEALADLRHELAEDIQEERRVEQERAAAAQLALSNQDQDQDAERAGLLEAAGLEPDDISEVGGIEEGHAAGLDAEAELFSDLASLDTDAEGRDIEEVEALADLRQEIAADIEAERSAEEEEQASEYELVLGDNDQDSGLAPQHERH